MRNHNEGHAVTRLEYEAFEALANKEGERNYVWLPIDAKFPKEAYENLQAAYDA